jgi:1-aminocyclopropane-1-carboxylate deaminase
VRDLLKDRNQKNWSINLDYHFGGFAKTDQQLFSFMNDFEQTTGIQLEPIYTGKMFYGLFDLIRQGKFKKCHRIIAIHTGGLQGRNGFQQLS